MTNDQLSRNPRNRRARPPHNQQSNTGGGGDRSGGDGYGGAQVPGAFPVKNKDVGMILAGIAALAFLVFVGISIFGG